MPRAGKRSPPPLRSSEFLEHAMRTWGDMVLRLALSQLRNATDAEDVFQVAFLRLLKDTTPFNDDEHVKAWLLRVTINRCRDVGRSRSKRLSERRLPANNDPLEFYASKMREVKASERLLDSVCQEADAARTAAQQAEESQTTCDASQQTSDPRPTRNTTTKTPHTSRRARIVHPRKTKQPARFKFATASCLAALALVVGISLTLSNLNIFGPGGGSTFTIKAYGAVDDTLFPTGSNDIIAFNCETETQRFVSPDPETYENEGFYTGCVFSVEGENITRIQADGMSKLLELVP